MKAKRVAMGLLVAATPLLFAGCGAKKTITCESDEDDMKASVKLVFNEKKHEFESGTIGVVMDLSDYDKDEIDEKWEELKYNEGLSKTDIEIIR